MKIASKFQVVSDPSKERKPSIGIFADLLDDDECPDFSTSNLTGKLNPTTGELQKVAVYVYKEEMPENQAPEMFLCSKELSKVVRKAIFQLGFTWEEMLQVLLTLNVFENSKGRFIAVKSVKRDRFSKKKLLARAKQLSYNDLTAVNKQQ